MSELCFNNVQIEVTDNALHVIPHFVCPYCAGHPQNLVYSEPITIHPDQPLDFNSLVVFTLPCCNRQFQLYLAVHKSQDKDDLIYRVQRSSGEGVDGIPPDWWRLH